MLERLKRAETSQKKKKKAGVISVRAVRLHIPVEGPKSHARRLFFFALLDFAHTFHTTEAER